MACNFHLPRLNGPLLKSEPSTTFMSVLAWCAVRCLPVSATVTKSSDLIRYVDMGMESFLRATETAPCENHKEDKFIPFS